MEVWEDTCCCWPIRLVDVPVIIDRLKHFVDEDPLRFPRIPNPPDPSPIERAKANNVHRALALNKIPLQFAPNTDLARHLESLQSVSAEEAIRYVELNPPLVALLVPMHLVDDR